MSGKGDRPRHNLAKYGDGWERIFAKKVEPTSNKQTRQSWGKRRQQAAQDRSC